MADLPTGDDGTLDRAAFTGAVTEAAAEAARDTGAGRVHGFGATADTGTDYTTAAESAVAGAFGRTVKEA